MSRLFHDDGYYTLLGKRAASDVAYALRPLIQDFLDRGMPIREISHVINLTVNDLENDFVLGRGKLSDELPTVDLMKSVFTDAKINCWKEAISSRNLIHAIKTYRNLFCSNDGILPGLKESKDMCENMAIEMGIEFERNR